MGPNANHLLVLLSLSVDFDGANYATIGGETVASPGAQLVFHSPFDLPVILDPDENIPNTVPLAAGGQEFMVKIAKEMHTFLPSPYWSKCRDYRADRAKYKTGPISKNMCLENCMFQAIINESTCIPAKLLYRATQDTLKDICKDQQLEIQHGHRNFTDGILYHQCKNECVMDCTSYTYEVTWTTIQKPHGPPDEGLGTPDGGPGPPDDGPDQEAPPPDSRPILDEQDRLCKVKLYYKSLNQKLMEYKPQYKWNNLMADLGGFLGLWLGVSLVSAPSLILQTIEQAKRVRSAPYQLFKN